MENIIIVVILVAVIGSVVLYLVKSKKRGDRCVGCPYAKQCGGKCETKNHSTPVNNDK